MKYIHNDNLNSTLSQLVYGTGNSVLQGGDASAASRCLDIAWESGFRVFDSANAYGNAENNLGLWIENSGHRDELTLLTKGMNCGMNGSDDIYSAETIRQQVDESLRRLRTDRIDIYLLHRDDETKDVAEVVEALNECRSAGKIRVFGGSNWKKHRIEQANEYAYKHSLQGFQAVSPCFSMTEMIGDPWNRSVSISGEKNQEYREWLRINQFPVFNYSSLARGFLSGKYRTSGELPAELCLSPATIEEYYYPVNVERLRRAEQMAAEKQISVSNLAIAWILHQGLNIYPIVGPASEKHIRELSNADGISLTQEECEYLFNG